EAEVRYLGSNRFTAQLTNVMTQQSFSVTATVPNAKRSSAEWIAEAPSGAGGTLPLADFGKASYGFDNTGVSSTCFASVGGFTNPIGSFSSSVVQEITMVSHAGAIKAQPSFLSSDGTPVLPSRGRVPARKMEHRWVSHAV